MGLVTNLRGPQGPAGTGSTAWPASGLVVFVDYANGSDSAGGLAPSTSFKTIQAAYSALISNATSLYQAGSSGTGVGTIRCLPGDHDVGSGLSIDYRYPVELCGTLSGGIPYQTGINSGSRLVSSSSSASQLVLTGSPSHVSYGNYLHDLAFAVGPGNTGMTALVRAQANDYLIVERCQGSSTNGSTFGVPLLEQSPGGTAQDNAWLRLRDCQTRAVALYYAKAGTNFNRSLIEGCVVQFSGSIPGINLEGEWWNGLVIGNNLEGNMAAHIRVGSSSHSFLDTTFIANAGESGVGANPFYDVVRGNRCQFIGGDCTATDGTVGIWANIASASYGNLFQTLYADFVGQSSFKRKISDSAQYPTETQLVSWAGTVRYTKSGASLGGSDFHATPPNGSFLGYTNNGGTLKAWHYVNGSFVSVTIA